jgi:Family of unknown function (DUF6134)
LLLFFKKAALASTYAAYILDHPALTPYLAKIVSFLGVSRTMDRRRFLASTGAVALAGPAFADTLPVPPGGTMAFKVLRNGSPIGEHRLVFTRDGDDLSIAIHVALRVTIAAIPVFYYALQATERWFGGVFQSLDSQINDNGNHLEVHAQKTALGYDVVGTHVPRYTCPPNTLPLTYWNRAMLYGTILNIQTAHSYPATVHSPGWNKLPTTDGGFVIAQRFDVTGKLRLSVWYDQIDQWSGLAFHLHGYESYEKITAPS